MKQSMQKNYHNYQKQEKSTQNSSGFQTISFSLGLKDKWDK